MNCPFKVQYGVVPLSLRKNMEQKRVKDAANQPNLYSVVSVDMYALGNNHLKFTPAGNTHVW